MSEGSQVEGYTILYTIFFPFGCKTCLTILFLTIVGATPSRGRCWNVVIAGFTGSYSWQPYGIYGATENRSLGQTDQGNVVFIGLGVPIGVEVNFRRSGSN